MIYNMVLLTLATQTQQFRRFGGFSHPNYMVGSVRMDYGHLFSGKVGTESSIGTGVIWLDCSGDGFKLMGSSRSLWVCVCGNEESSSARES